DLKGEYEPAVTFGEAASLRAEAPRLVSRYVAERAREAAQREDLRAALRAFRVLRGARLPRALLQEYERETFGPLEDSLTAKIDEAVYVPAYVTFGAILRNHSNKAWRRFCLLQPSLALFVELAGADSYAVRRVFEHASAELLRLAKSFETAGCYRECVYVCRVARSLAPPASEKLPEIEAKLRALDAGEGLRERTFEQYAAALPRVLPEVRVPPGMFTDDPRGGTTLEGGTQPAASASGGLMSCLFWLLMVAVGVGVRACVGASSGPRYPINSLPRLTMPPPNLNFNYNVTPPNVNVYRPPSNLNLYRPPSNLNLYRPQPPTAVRPREGRGKRGANSNTPPRE
ncbi:MAG TPA: hypothetical protein VNZ44_02705, partial [Pyrinomonadaceae bacterium]|nr:hypothetical protein [Pyrinomonadaceae bacterium]